MRPLVLANDDVSHAFRRSLPSDIAKIAEEDHDLTAAAKGKWLGEDVSLFLLSFLAFFTAFYTFIF
ncbi:hypothetical protein [Parasphingorhabdus sp.]|uniref:hypothetical protein n=1 Tax=Parasphingorhabdus sp. TaxID=2709688 RepID=UPI003A94BC39